VLLAEQFAAAEIAPDPLLAFLDLFYPKNDDNDGSCSRQNVGQSEINSSICEAGSSLSTEGGRRNKF